jgi:hypothetical protein
VSVRSDRNRCASSPHLVRFGSLAFTNPSSALQFRGSGSALLSLKDTHRFARHGSWSHPGGFVRSPHSSHEVHRRSPPPFLHLASTPSVSRKTRLWLEDATPLARSALVVPPDFGGLLRVMPCRFVAPCYRPWGSPRFPLAFPEVCSRSPKALYPFKAFPSLAAPLHVTGFWAVHRRAIPSRRCSWLFDIAPCCHFALTGFHSLDLRALFRQKVRCIPPALPPMKCPMLSWAYAPTSLRLPERTRSRISIGIHVKDRFRRS